MLKKLLQHISIPSLRHLKPGSRKRVFLRRYLAAMLCGCMMVPTIGSIAMATEEPTEKTAYVSGPCEHHTVHDATCGYVEAIEGAPCTHSHDENCGYVEAKDEVPCFCTDTDGDGIINHDEGCGYQAAVEGQPCNHVHDADCGYVEAVEGQPCGYVCEICSGEELNDEPAPLSDTADVQAVALADSTDNNAADSQTNPEQNPLAAPEITALPKEQTCIITVPERELIAGQTYTLSQLLEGVTAEIEDTSEKTDEVAEDTPADTDKPEEKPQLAVGIQKIVETVGEETQTFDTISDDFSLSVAANAAYIITYFAYDAADEAKTTLATKDASVTALTVVGNVMIGAQGYETLAEAIEAAVSNDVIKVQKDIAENVTLNAKENVTIDLNGHTLNSGEVGKNVVTILGGKVTIQNGVITGGSYNKTNEDGKGILTNSADVTLKNVEIKGNKGYGKGGTTPGYGQTYGGYGGGIYAYAGSLKLESCTVSENEAGSEGGGIYVHNSTATITGGTKVINNTCGGGNVGGAGITVNGGTLNIDGATISGNVTSNSRRGMAIGLTGANVTATIKNAELSAAYDSGDASIIYAQYGKGPIDLDLENVDVVNKAGTNTLYAIYSAVAGTFTAKNCTFHDSNGSIYLSKATEISFDNCQFLNNDASYRSAYAPVYLAGSGNASFTGCTFTGNTGYYAGAVYKTSTGTLTIDGCQFSKNSATNSSSAGAIYTSKGTTTVTNTVIKENTTSGTNSSGPAGGVSVYGSGTVFNMDSGALYNNKSEKQSAPAHDVYIYSSAKANILAGKDMKDGDVDFSSYAWSDLSRNLINDKLTMSGNWTATPAAEYAASIGETKYKTLDEAFKAAREQSRNTGENVTVEVVEGYIPLNTYYGVTSGKYPAKVTLHLNNTNIYGVGISNSFSVDKDNTLTLSGTGTLNKKIYMMGGTLNLDGNVVISNPSLSFNNAPIYDNKKDSTKININGDVDLVQIALYQGTVTVGENAHVGKLEALMTTSSGQVLPTNFVMNGDVKELLLTQSTGKSTATLNGHIGSLKLTHGTEIYGTKTFPTTTAGENLSVDNLNVYPALSSITAFDKETGLESNGAVSFAALQDPTQKVNDLMLIKGGGGKVANAIWTTTMNNKHTDGKDYKFLTTVISDDNGDLVLHKTAVGNGNYVFIGGNDADDANDGITLTTPVKTFKRALEVLQANPEAKVISVLGTVSVTGDETWAPAEGMDTVTLASFPTFSGELVNVPSGASLTLQNITIDGLKISRTTPLVENKGTLNIASGAKLTGGVNSVIYGPNRGGGVDGGAVYNSGTLNMTDGEISDNSARTGGGVFNRGTFNLGGGTISNNVGYDLKRFSYDYGGSSKVNSAPAGGGVFLAGGGNMNMSGGTISGNTSCVGGGIALGNETNAYIAYSGANLTMTGGNIDGNTAGQGGGVFIQEMCEATITGGNITNNHATGDFSVATGYGFLYGGGGIYVNGGTGMTKKDGVLRLKSTAITGNTSNSNGGGIAGCPSANVEVMMGDSSVLGLNTVNEKPYDAYINRTIVVGPPGTTHSGGTKFYLSKYMKGGELYKWHYYGSNPPEPVLYQDVSNLTYQFDKTDRKERTESGFYSAADANIINAAAKNCAVTISGNTSAMGGGGIGTNGALEIGTEPASNDFFDVIVQKNWINADGNALTEDEMTELQKQIQSITVTLERRIVGTETWEQVDNRLILPGEDGFWKMERPFTNLLKQLDGKDLEYQVVEEASLTGAWSELNGGTIRIATPPIRQNDGEITVDVPINTETIEEGYFNANITLVGWDKSTQNLQSKYDSFSVTLTDTKHRSNWTWSWSNTDGKVTLEGSVSSMNAPEVTFNKSEGKFIIKNLPNSGKYTTTVVYKEKADNKQDTAIAPIEQDGEQKVVEVTPQIPTEGDPQQPVDGFFNATASLEWSVTQEIEAVDENGEKTTVQKTINLAEEAKTVTVTLTNAKDPNETWNWSMTPGEWKALANQEAKENEPGFIVEQTPESTDLTFTGLSKDGEYSLNITYSSDSYGDVNIASSEQSVSWSGNNASNSFGKLKNKPNPPSLTLEKVIVGDLADKEFNFTITFTDKDGNEIKSVEHAITGSGSETIPIPDGVSVGDKFTITEAEGDWNTNASGTNVTNDVEFDSAKREATGTLCWGKNTVTFTNTERGLLSIPVTKTVEITANQPSAIPDFTFTLQLNKDASTSKNFDKIKLAEDLTIGEETFTAGTSIEDVIIPLTINGSAFTSEGGKTVSASFVPLKFEEAGTYAFTIREVAGTEKNWTYDSANWNVTITVAPDDTGKLVATPEYKKDETVSENVSFTNKYEAGRLTINKTVSGTAGDTNKEFTFNVTLLDFNNAPLSILTSDIRVTDSNGTQLNSADLVQQGQDGKLSIKLKHGQSAVVSNLPIGTKYNVSEAEANQDGYTTTATPNNAVNTSEATGTITAETANATAAFVNSKNEQPQPEYGNLTISKVVSGNRSSTQRDFTFTVTLRDANGNLLAGTYPYTGSHEGNVENGTATFPLRHGQSITISGLPAGTAYEVSEEAGDYSPTVSNGSGTITAGTTITAAFDNYRNGGGGGGGGRRPTPDTEIDEPPVPQVYYPGEEPDPNEPDSPEEITIIDEDVPQTYIKTWDPENEEYVYLPEEPTPLAPMTPTPTPLARLDTTPKTDDPNHPWFWLGLCFASILGIGLLKPRKKHDEK